MYALQRKYTEIIGIGMTAELNFHFATVDSDNSEMWFLCVFETALEPALSNLRDRWHSFFNNLYQDEMYGHLNWFKRVHAATALLTYNIYRKEQSFVQ